MWGNGIDRSERAVQEEFMEPTATECVVSDSLKKKKEETPEAYTKKQHTQSKHDYNILHEKVAVIFP